MRPDTRTMATYRKFMKDFNIGVQFCLAHLIRDIRFLITLPDREEKEYGKKLLAQMRGMFKLIHDNDDKPRAPEARRDGGTRKDSGRCWPHAG